MKEKNIVLLHGWGASTTKLVPLGDELKKLKWNVYIPQIPGFDAKSPSNAWYLEDYANFISEISHKKWKGKPYYVFGHSNGGRIAIKIAVSFNESLKGIILCATGGISRSSLLKRSLFFMLAKVGKAFLVVMPVAKVWEKLLYKAAREHDYEKTSGVMRQTFKNIITENLKPYIRLISVPVLVLWGEKDKMTPLKDAYFIRNHLQNGTLKVYKDDGHRLPYTRYKDIAKTIDQNFKN